MMLNEWGKGVTMSFGGLVSIVFGLYLFGESVTVEQLIVATYKE